MSREDLITPKHDIEAIVQAATRAPSLHNSQPWHFVAGTEPSGSYIDVFAVPARAVPVVDPLGRELHISLGAALALGEIAAGGLGRDCRTELLPEPVEADRVARIHLGQARAPEPHAVELAGAIERRYTERARFDERQVSPDVAASLGAVAVADGVWLKMIDRSTDQVSLAVLLARADEAERANPDYEAELEHWLRPSGPSQDGVPLGAVKNDSPRASSLRQRNFTGGTPESGGAAEPPPAEHPLVAVIGTADDDARAWLLAGMALGRLLIEAAAIGVFASPLTQVLEVPSTRAMAAGAIGALGHLQMVLRLGYASGQPATGRLPLADVLTYA